MECAASTDSQKLALESESTTDMEMDERVGEVIDGKIRVAAQAMELEERGREVIKWLIACIYHD